MNKAILDTLEPGSISRRAFTAGFGLALGGGSAPGQSAVNYKAIDCHAHLSYHGNPSWADIDRALIETADRLGIEQLCCSLLSPRHPTDPDEFRRCNTWAAEAMRRFPGRILCYAYVNPGYVREAHEEIRRCIEDLNFIGVKLYNDYLATEPVVAPVVEQVIELRVPLLHHAGHTSWLESPQPRISDGAVLAALGARYPEAMIICGHICGGGDWEWTIKALRNAPSVYLDTSGSVPDEGVIEMAVRTLGAGRLVFGCDMSMTAGIGRIRCADISETDKAMIFAGNMRRILARRRA